MPTGITRVGDLEIEQDHAFQHLSWKLQRYLWAGLLGLLVLGLLGLFGSGPLSRTTVGDDSGPLHLEYQRFGRFRSESELEIDLKPGRGTDGEARLTLSREFLDRARIEQVEPTPERVVAGPEGTAFHFLVADPDRPIRVTIHYRPERVGVIRGRLGLAGGPPLEFAEFIYP